MIISEINTKLEELMLHYYNSKQRYVDSVSGVIQDSDRYYRLDGIKEGLEIAWASFQPEPKT